MPREFRFRPALFKRSSKIQWPSLPPSLLSPLVPPFNIRFRRTLHHHLGDGTKKKKGNANFGIEHLKPTRVCQYVGTAEGRRRWGRTIYPWGCPEQELRFRRNEIEGLLSFSALPGPDVSANEAKKDTPRPIG